LPSVQYFIGNHHYYKISLSENGKQKWGLLDLLYFECENKKGEKLPSGGHVMFKLEGVVLFL